MNLKNRNLVKWNLFEIQLGWMSQNLAWHKICLSFRLMWTGLYLKSSKEKCTCKLLWNRLDKNWYIFVNTELNQWNIKFSEVAIKIYVQGLWYWEMFPVHSSPKFLYSLYLSSHYFISTFVKYMNSSNARIFSLFILLFFSR